MPKAPGPKFQASGMPFPKLDGAPIPEMHEPDLTVIDALAEPLPDNDLRSALALLTKLGRLPQPLHRAQRAALQERIKAVGLRVQRLQHGPPNIPTPPIITNKHLAQRGVVAQLAEIRNSK